MVPVSRMLIFYCGLELEDESLWFGFLAGVGSVPGAVLCEVVGIGSARGASGTVVMALSGFSRWSLLGPSPSLISARESGTVLLCQPWSAWYLRIASSLDWFHVPVASPLR